MLPADVKNMLILLYAQTSAIDTYKLGVRRSEITESSLDSSIPGLPHGVDSLDFLQTPDLGVVDQTLGLF